MKFGTVDKAGGLAVSAPSLSESRASLDIYPYKTTFIFIALYYLISHGRLHLLIPVLQKIPSAMILGILAVISFVVEYKKNGDQWHFIREEKLLAGLIMMCIASLPLSVWPGNSFNSLYKGYLPTVILAFIAGFICKSPKDIEKFLWVYVINCTLVIFMALSAGIGHFSTGVTDMYDVNDIAMVLVCSLPITFYLMLQQQGFKKFILSIFMLLTVITIIKTGSRGGALGLLAIAGYVVLNSRSKIKALVISTIALVILFAFAPEESKERFVTMVKPETEYDQNYGDRKQIWTRGITIALSSPLVGAGIGNYTVADGSSKDKMGPWKAAHNSYLQIAVELGLIGFVLYVLLTIGTFIKLHLMKKAVERMEPPSPVVWIIKGAELTMLAFIVTTFFLSQAYNPQFYFILAMIVAAKKMVNQQLKIQQSSAEII